MNRQLQAYNERRRRAAKARRICNAYPYKVVIMRRADGSIIETRRFKTYDAAQFYADDHNNDPDQLFIAWIE